MTGTPNSSNMQINNHKITVKYSPPIHSPLLGHYINSNCLSVFLACSWQAAPYSFCFPMTFSEKNLTSP
ncbi:hypothetical protein I79_024669 [Cricetulus griseus]|uniref:Uncharacterized protein n=1 Tax=Cricetulus griseus TaxID=10029 RepID=G3ILA6_CRIGR|nr:hypothetical protein I79_024669 [Cricetulus griseus]